jgi:hypothetical protein
MTITLLILVGVVALVVVGIVSDVLRTNWASCFPMPRPFAKRHSQEAIWRERYPEETLATVDTVLRMVCEAFRFNPNYRYQFVWHDRVYDIYRACYPPWKLWQLSDRREIESLAFHLEQALRIDISQDYPDITLGEIVERAKKANRSDEATAWAREFVRASCLQLNPQMDRP